MVKEVAEVIEKPDGAGPRAVGRLVRAAGRTFDVAILGAGFAGSLLAPPLPGRYRVLFIARDHAGNATRVTRWLIVGAPVEG